MLARAHRFHGLNSLSSTYRSGKTLRASSITLKYSLNTRRQTYRAAVVVSKKVHKSAVVRNRIRRRIFTIVQANEVRISQPYDLIFTVFDEQVATMEAAHLQRLIIDQLQKAGVVTY